MRRSWIRSRKARYVAVLLVLALTGVVAWRPAYVSWQIRSARTTLDFGDEAAVQRALRQLLSLEGLERADRPELLYLLGRASRRAGDLEQAFAYFERAAAGGWSAQDLQHQRYLALVQRARFGDSEAYLKGILARSVPDPLAYEIYEALAKGYLHAYRFQDALYCLDFWIEWRPDAVEPRLWRAAVWEQTQDWERANGEYRAILEIEPSQKEARCQLAGNLLLKLNEVELAYEEFQRCLRDHPDEVGALLGVAMCEQRMAQPEEAEKRFRALLERPLSRQQRVDTLLELGQSLLDRRQVDEGIELLSEAAHADPRNGVVQHALGLAWAANGQPARAAEHFERSRVLTESYNRLADITSHLLSEPDNVELRWEAGMILMEHGMEYEGAAWLSTALMYDPEHRKTHEALAEYYTTVKVDPRMAAHHQELARHEHDRD